MFNATVKMLDGTEKHIHVASVERDYFKLAPPLEVDMDAVILDGEGRAKYQGKGTGEPAVYTQQSL